MDADRKRTGLWEFGEKNALKRQRKKWKNSKEMDIMFCALCIVMLLYNTNQQNAPFLN